MSSVQNKEIVHRVAVEFWNQHKLDIVDQVFLPEYRNIGPGVSEVADLNGFLNRTKMIFTAFPDFHVDTVQLIAEGDAVVKVWKAQGTFEGEFMGASPNHKVITWAGVTVYRFMEGKIKECEWGYDTLGAMQQMGAIPVAASAS